MRLGRIGLDRVVGFLDGGLRALEGRDELLQRSERTTAQALAARLGRPDSPLVLDVRTEKEWVQGHVEGSLNVPLGKLAERLDDVPKDRELAIVCRSGYRSSAALSLLESQGRQNLIDTVGGMDAWSASDLPVVVLESPSCQA